MLANDANAANQLERVESRVGSAATGKRALAALAAQWAVGRPSLYAIPSAFPSLKLGETIYHRPGPVRGMPEWAAAVVEALRTTSAQESIARRTAAARWSQIVANEANSSAVAFSERPNTAAGWLRFPMLVSDAAVLRDRAARRLGIMCGYKQILADLPLAPGRLANNGPWPGAAELAARLRTLPTHSLVSSTDVAAIVRLLARTESRRS